MSKITITNIIVDDINKCKWLVDGVCRRTKYSIEMCTGKYPEILGKECIEGNYKCFEKEDGEIVP